MVKFMASMYYNSYSLPTYNTLWNAEAFVDTTVIPIILMFIINYAVLSSKLKISPLQFLRRELSKKTRKKAIRLNTKIPFMHRFRLRVVFQNVSNYITLFVGILFVVGLISSTYSAAGSALTALTTSFTVDILQGTRRYGDERLTRIRKGVHVGMAVGMALVILGFEYLADDSVINLVYKVASYTYGPILGMFAFGMFTRLRIRDGWMPVVAVAAPVLSALVQYWAREAWDYRIGFELLIYNAVFTMAGMLLLAKKNEN